MCTPCSKCNKNKPIVNRTKWLCDTCNYERLHNGVSRAQVYSERVKERVEQKVPKLNKIKFKQKYIKQQTSKEKEIKEKLSAIKLEKEIEAQQDNHYYCWGCGQAGSLDKSHILSVKQRKDLECEKSNINLLCRGCHMDWESNDAGKMLKLHCFEKDLIYIGTKDIGRYNEILQLIDDWILKQFDILLIEREAVDSELLAKANKVRENYNFKTH